MTGNDDGLSALARAYRNAAPWLSAVWQFTGTALVGAAAGYGLDRWLGTGPWALVGGVVLGNALGLFAFMRAVTRLMEKKQP